MNKTKLTHRLTKGLRLLVIPALLAVALGVVPLAQAVPVPRIGSVPDEGQGPVELLQFTARSSCCNSLPPGTCWASRPRECTWWGATTW